MSQQVLFPVGRMVWGSLSKPQTKDFHGNPCVERWTFGVAIPKGREGAWWETPWGSIILQEAQTGFASQPGLLQRYDFAWKVVDGDSTVPNRKGNIPNQQEGYPGHWVLSFSSQFVSTTHSRDGSQQIDPSMVKAGYYIEVLGSVAANGNMQNPGVYLNHNMVALAGYGPEIFTGPDPKTAGFGQSALPPGASNVPSSGMGAAGGPPSSMPPNMNGQQMPPGAPSQMPPGAQPFPPPNNGPQGHVPPSNAAPAPAPSTATYPSSGYPQQQQMPPGGQPSNGYPTPNHQFVNPNGR